MPNPKAGAQDDRTTTSPDSLTRTTGDAGIALTESALDKVSGGAPDVTQHQQKGADKAAAAADALIRG